jgi:FkbM family methyltransferase
MPNHPEHFFTKFYQPRGTDVYVEVGASFGSTAVLLPESVRKILIEPEEKSADILVKMIYDGELKNAIVVRTGIASKKGTLEFRVMDRVPNCSRLVESPTHQLAQEQNKERGPKPDWTPEGEPVDWQGRTITIETDTLEAILDGLGIDHIDLLASDCESCEFDMVNYAGKWLDPKKVRNWAVAAYHITARANEIVEKLASAGYRIGYDYGGGSYHGDPATGAGQIVVFGLAP